MLQSSRRLAVDDHDHAGIERNGEFVIAVAVVVADCMTGLDPSDAEIDRCQAGIDGSAHEVEEM